ncbi:MAG: hypothetical protein OXC62_04320, partial [Aestuariivita sp.]|nr:hypothetical protein [Aestuariivita sp.]
FLIRPQVQCQHLASKAMGHYLLRTTACFLRPYCGGFVRNFPVHFGNETRLFQRFRRWEQKGLLTIFSASDFDVSAVSVDGIMM